MGGESGAGKARSWRQLLHCASTASWHCAFQRFFVHIKVEKRNVVNVDGMEIFRKRRKLSAPVILLSDDLSI